VAGRIVAEGRAVGGGRSTCFCEARLVGAGGDIAAQAMGTYRYREAAAAP
jgi:acyl-coenzyme A thioesterase PaaI-like protein